MVTIKKDKLVITIDSMDPATLHNELKNSVIGILQNIKYEPSELLEIESCQYFLLMLLKKLSDEVIIEE